MRKESVQMADTRILPVGIDSFEKTENVDSIMLIKRI